MSQAQGQRQDSAFDGRIQLNGDGAPELEVIVELDDEFLVLGHSSGELGRWEKSTVHVAPIGRGWFTLDVEDEQVTFLPRRPGFFAAATVDLVPVEETKKRFRRKAPRKATREAEPEAERRKEPKRRRRRETAKESVAPAAPSTETPLPVAEPVEPVVKPDPVPPPIEAEPVGAEPPPVPAESTAVWVEPAPAPEIRRPSPPPQPLDEPASPWDDLPIPEVPGTKPREKKSSPDRPGPLPLERVKRSHKKPPKLPREKPIKPAAAPRTPGPPQKSAFSRAFAGFRHGLKGMALRISDELRQTGIVPFDRLPAAPGRPRPDEDHKHTFQELRLPGGLNRNVCYECGLVSIGESSEDA